MMGKDVERLSSAYLSSAYLSSSAQLFTNRSLTKVILNYDSKHCINVYIMEALKHKEVVECLT